VAYLGMPPRGRALYRRRPPLRRATRALLSSMAFRLNYFVERHGGGIEPTTVVETGITGGDSSVIEPNPKFGPVSHLASPIVRGDKVVVFDLRGS